MNLIDLSTLLAAVDIAIKRGVFSVFEVGAVGEVATKLNNFLLDAKKQQEEAAAAAVPAETPDAPAETQEGQAQA